MKKSLIALAALAAIGSASAQSTVNITGALILGVGTTELGTATSDLQMVRSTGNIGFSGTEDLGGGLKAGFNFQTTFGQAAATDKTVSVAGQRTLLGDRQAHLTLSGGFGTILTGKASSAVKSMGGIYDVTGLPLINGLGTGDSAASASTAGNIEVAAGDTNARIIYGDAFSNQVAYSSPSISGFTVSVGIVPTQTVSSGVGDDSVGKDTVSYSLNYTNGPLVAAVNLTDVQGGTAPYQLTTVAANYDLGIAKIGVTQQSVRLDSGVNPGNATAITIGVPVGSGQFGAGYGRRLASASTNTSFGDDVKHTFIGYKHNLSKRTAISAIYSNIDRTGTTTDLKETHILIGHSF
jgi:predicted porin